MHDISTQPGLHARNRAQVNRTVLRDRSPAVNAYMDGGSADIAGAFIG